jgi:hypothetical protein
VFIIAFTLQLFSSIAHAEEIFIPSSSDKEIDEIYNAVSLGLVPLGYSVARPIVACRSHCSGVTKKNKYSLSYEFQSEGSLNLVEFTLWNYGEEIDSIGISGITNEQLSQKSRVLVAKLISKHVRVESIYSNSEIKDVNNFSVSEISLFDRAMNAGSAVKKEEQIISKAFEFGWGGNSKEERFSLGLSYSTMNNWSAPTVNQGFIYSDLSQEQYDQYVEDGFDSESSDAWVTSFTEIYIPRNAESNSLGLEFGLQMNRFLDVLVEFQRYANGANVQRNVYSSESTESWRLQNTTQAPVYGVSIGGRTTPFHLGGIEPFIGINSEFVILNDVANSNISEFNFSSVDLKQIWLGNLEFGTTYTFKKLYVQYLLSRGIIFSDLPQRTRSLNPNLEDVENLDPSYSGNLNSAPKTSTISFGLNF